VYGVVSNANTYTDGQYTFSGVIPVNQVVVSELVDVRIDSEGHGNGEILIG
jgi:hypothetical protein